MPGKSHTNSIGRPSHKLSPFSKVHKNPENPPYRPSVDYTESWTYRVAKALSELINAVIEKTGHHLKDYKIKHITLTEEEIWISHDVVGLPPSVPVGEALDVIRQHFSDNDTLKDHTFLSLCNIKDLLRLVVYFNQPSEGQGLGSPPS